MTEYLSKKAVLEWLDDRRYKSPWIESFRERLESGAFDADESEGMWKASAEILGRENKQMYEEIQRLRAALEYILEYWNRDENEDAMSDALWKIIEIAEEALSTTTEPKGDGNE